MLYLRDHHSSSLEQVMLRMSNIFFFFQLDWVVFAKDPNNAEIIIDVPLRIIPSCHIIPHTRILAVILKESRKYASCKLPNNFLKELPDRFVWLICMCTRVVGWTVFASLMKELHKCNGELHKILKEFTCQVYLLRVNFPVNCVSI